MKEAGARRQTAGLTSSPLAITFDPFDCCAPDHRSMLGFLFHDGS
jgi:hypothetical protein